MLIPSSIRLCWRSLGWLMRSLVIACGAVLALLAMVVVLLRYWFLPNIGQYHDVIVSSASRTIGSPVTIGKIEADWQGLRPRLDFRNVQIWDAQQQPALTLPHISNVVSWLSFATGSLRLYSLEIDSPQLLIRRDEHGKIFVGGIPISQQGSNNDLSDWILHQSRVVARNAKVVWLDEMRNASPLILDKVDVRISNVFSRHRFAIHATPPAELAKPLDVRGEFKGKSFDDLSAWQGQLFVQMDYADVASWGQWLKLPNNFSQGQGGIRAWMLVQHGKPTKLTVDLNLRDVTTQLAETAPPMMLNRLFGRINWMQMSDDMRLATQQLSGQLKNGITLSPTDLVLQYGKNGGKLEFNTIPLETLAAVSAFLPLDKKIREKIVRFNPHGTLNNFAADWQGDVNNPTKYTVKSKLENLSVAQVDNIPGVVGLTLDMKADEAGGEVVINSPQLVLDTGPAMREVFPASLVEGKVRWSRKANEWLLEVLPTHVVNADLDGKVHAIYTTKQGSLGTLDLQANLTRGNVRQAARYTPIIAVDRAGNDWIHSSILSGVTKDLYVKVKGDLAQFPPGPGKNAFFELGAHAQGVTVDFATGWPRIDNIVGEVLIRNNTLQVKAQSATMAGARIQNAVVDMPDFQNPHLPLLVKGQAQATSNTFLKFIQDSPVRGYIDGFTDGMSATGNALLDLSLYVPLMDIDKPAGTAQIETVKVNGTVQVQDNDIYLGEGIPILQKTAGSLVFSESGMQTKQVSTYIWGEPAAVNVKSGSNGSVHATLLGKNSIESLRKVQSHAALASLSGSVAWQADIQVLKKNAQVTIQSDLLGLSSQLPMPFNKRADEKWPLKVENNQEDGFNVQLANLLAVRTAQKEGKLKRLQLNFANSGGWTDKEGIWITGSLPTLSLTGWGGLLKGEGDSTLSGVDLRIARMNMLGQHVQNMHIQGRSKGEGFIAQLNSNVLNGDMEWQPKLSGHLTLRLKSLHLTSSEQAETVAAETSNTTSVSPDQLPGISLNIENLYLKNKAVGSVEVIGQPEWHGWRLHRLSLNNADAQLTGEGYWPSVREPSKLNMQLNIVDAGKLLTRMGYANTVKAGKGQIQGTFSWQGGPQDFAFSKLNGQIKLETGAGQFLKMEPGVGKLLSIFSLQALPRRIALDFNDVFSQGFQFDAIKGTAQINHGLMDIQDMYIDGSSAKVAMKGQVDLNNETQNLKVRVLPTVGNSVSLIGAFTAGPVVGVGALILNKVLGNPLDKMASFEYTVTGTWSDPNVAKVGQTPIEVQKSP